MNDLHNWKIVLATSTFDFDHVLGVDGEVIAFVRIIFFNRLKDAARSYIEKISMESPPV